MSTNVLLYSSHHITEEELAEVILQVQGVLTPEPETSSFRGIVEGSTHVWIDSIPCSFAPFDEQAIAVLEQVEVLLGGKLQEGIIPGTTIGHHSA